MPNRNIWSAEETVGRREYVAYILQNEEKPIHLITLAIVIGDIGGNPVPKRLREDRAAFHNSQYRRILTDDIKEISLSDDFPRMYIRSSSQGVKKCNREELIKKADEQRAAAKKLLWETKVLLRKAGVEDNLRLEDLL